MKNRKKIIIYISMIIVLVLILLATSYGYLRGKIMGNETSKKAVFNSQLIEVTFSDGIETLTSNQEGIFIPGSTIEKTFTIKNTGNVPVNYSINLKDIKFLKTIDGVTIETNFERPEDLTYTLKSNGEFLYNGLNETRGNFPSYDTYILSKDTLLVGETKTYTLTIKYLTSEENQIADRGKTINAKIVLDEPLKGN